MTPEANRCATAPGYRLLARIACAAVLCAVTLTLTLASAPVHASGLRCGQELIARGFLLYEVEERCGQPVSTFSRIDFRYPDRSVYVDEWVYEFGSTRFRRLLRFEDGRLERIETLRKPSLPRPRRVIDR